MNAVELPLYLVVLFSSVYWFVSNPCESGILCLLFSIVLEAPVFIFNFCVICIIRSQTWVFIWFHFQDLQQSINQTFALSSELPSAWCPRFCFHFLLVYGDSVCIWKCLLECRNYFMDYSVLSIWHLVICIGSVNSKIQQRYSPEQYRCWIKPVSIWPVCSDISPNRIKPVPFT